VRKLFLMWNDLETRGEIFKNIGLGFFVNGGYGVSLANFDIMNFIDILSGLILMLSGIYLERKEKWDD